MTFFSSTCTKNCCCYCYSHICINTTIAVHGMLTIYQELCLLCNTSLRLLNHYNTFTISPFHTWQNSSSKKLRDFPTVTQLRSSEPGQTPIFWLKAFAPSSVSYHHSSTTIMCQYHACDPNIYTDHGFFP